MKCSLYGVILAGLFLGTSALAQIWPDYHLTNGVHSTSYGVEDFDPDFPRHLYIDPTAVLNAGSTELDSIYASNHVFLAGGTVYASAVDSSGFSWVSGALHLDGGTHYTTYGLGDGIGKDLHIDAGATVQQSTLGAIPTGNNLYLNSGGTLSVGDFDASMAGFNFNAGGTLEVAGVLTGTPSTYYGYGQRNLIFRGSGASWNSGASALKVGNNALGYVTSLLVAAGADVASRGGELGVGSVEISGVGSRWDNDGELILGDSSSGNRLTVSAGGFVSTSGSYVGSIFGNNNQVTVSGAGSQWSSGRMIVGWKGTGNSLSIENGGSVTGSVASIGYSAGYGNWVEVSGINAQWNLSGGLIVGNGGNRNSLSIDNGGVVTSSGGWIGLSGNGYSANANSMVVEEAGSQWNNSGSLWIGSGNAIAPFINNYLAVYKGGTVENQDAHVALDNWVLVSGTNSLWKNRGELDLAGTLTVDAGGEVMANGGVVFDGSTGVLNLNAGGRLTLGIDFDASVEGFNFNAGSTLSVAGQVSGLPELEVDRRLEALSVLGDLVVHGTFAPGNSPAESVVTGALFIAADGTLEMEMGGYGPGTEYDRLTILGTATFNGSLDILFLNNFSPTNGANFHLFTWTDWAGGGFENINTPQLSGGLEWDTTDLYTTGTLSVIPEPGVLSLILVAVATGLFVRRLKPE